MKLSSFVEGNNWVYTIHILFVAPLLFYVAYSHIFNIKSELVTFMIYVQLSMAILIPIYHGHKLFKNLNY